MKINRALFRNKDYVLEEEIDFSQEQFDPYHIRRIESCKVKVVGSLVEDLLLLDVSIDVKVIGVCSYTLEDVPLDLHIVDSIDITDQKDNESDDVFYEKDNIFSFDSYVLSLIVSEVPLVIIKEGATLPNSGDGFRVIDESQYEKERENKKDSRWSKLDDIEL